MGSGLDKQILLRLGSVTGGLINLNSRWHVVLGGGPLGLAVVRRLIDQGRPVRLATRSTRSTIPGVETVNLDASDAGKLQKVCRDASVLYFCASPPYGSPELLVPLVQGVTQGVARAGCRLVYADNLYAYGQVVGPVSEGLPHQPVGPKGRARAAAVDHVLEAHRLERIGADVVSASDFYGPGVTFALLGDRVFRPAIDGGTINLLGNADAPHSYTYIEDFARAIVVIAGEAGSFGQIWHVPEAETLTTRNMVERIISEAGGEASYRVAPKWLEAVLGVFSKPVRELRETAYQRDGPWVVQANRLRERFGFQPTSIVEAIAATVRWYRQRFSRKTETLRKGRMNRKPTRK